MKRLCIAALLFCAPAAVAQQMSGGGIKIGILTDMNSVYSAISGPGSVKSAEMAVDDFTKANKDFAGKVSIVAVDHLNKPDIATSKANEMFSSQQVDVIMDTVTSSCALAIAAVAQEQNKLFINTGAGTSELTNEKCNHNTFHYAYDNYMLANGTGTAITKAGGKTWYMIYPNYAFGKNLEFQMRTAVEKAGGKVVAPSDATPFPNTDFSSFLLKAQSLKPQVFGTMQAGADLVNVVKQYNEFGLKKQGIGLAIGLLFESDIRALGQDAFEGAIATVPWFWQLDEKAKDWAHKFEKAFGKKPSFDQAAVYSAVTTYLEAVKRAKTDDAEKVIAALEGHKFSDFFAHDAEIRKQDHRVILDVYQVKVKPKKEAKEDGDFYTKINTTPAKDAFTPLSESKCKMAQASR
ncbi:MAG: ABC transporter substrate-binding protein [Myxococcales bacterium]